jgi:hypothetical protein
MEVLGRLTPAQSYCGAGYGGSGLPRSNSTSIRGRSRSTGTQRCFTYPEVASRP